MLLSEGRWREGAVATELGWLGAGSRRSGDRRNEAFVWVFIYEKCLVTNWHCWQIRYEKVGGAATDASHNRSGNTGIEAFIRVFANHLW